MRHLATCFALAVSFLAALPLAGQAPADAVKTFASAADIQALIAKAKADHKPGEPNTLEDIVLLPPYVGHLEYRTGVGPSAVHEREAELFIVLEGSGTMVTGGKLVNGKQVDAANQQGTAIEDGASRPVAKGDVIFVPQDTPHWFSKVNGTLILMSLHVPRPVPEEK